MLRTMLFSKLHRVTTTAAEVDYIGSCAIDQALLDASGMLPYEQVHVWNVTTGARFVTYTIEAPRDSGIISVNGSAAHHASPGDLLILATFAHIDATEAAQHQPRVVFVDAHNRPISEDQARSLGIVVKPTPDA